MVRPTAKEPAMDAVLEVKIEVRLVGEVLLQGGYWHGMLFWIHFELFQRLRTKGKMRCRDVT